MNENVVKERKKSLKKMQATKILKEKQLDNLITNKRVKLMDGEKNKIKKEIKDTLKKVEEEIK
jgi:hypothetical protein